MYIKVAHRKLKGTHHSEKIGTYFFIFSLGLVWVNLEVYLFWFSNMRYFLLEEFAGLQTILATQVSSINKGSLHSGKAFNQL